LSASGVGPRNHGHARRQLAHLAVEAKLVRAASHEERIRDDERSQALIDDPREGSNLGAQKVALERSCFVDWSGLG
jgi:hypothetical protein